MAWAQISLEVWKENLHILQSRYEEAVDISNILRELKGEEYSDRNLMSMSKMLAYMGLIESLGVAMIDIVLMLMIKDGRYIHTRAPYTRHIKRFKDLEHIDLAYKLDFLRSEGFELFDNLINLELRNTIAHLKFTIDQGGQVRKKDMGRSPIDIDNAISKFWNCVDTLKRIFEDLGLRTWLIVEIEKGIQ
jgi:hypothetical protein